jgi:hypothetical protein
MAKGNTNPVFCNHADNVLSTEIGVGMQKDVSETCAAWGYGFGRRRDAGGGFGG